MRNEPGVLAVIVPVAWASARAAPDGDERSTRKVSLSSETASEQTGTLMVLTCSPAAKLTVPEVET
jgi:hypothetical protein